MAIHMDGQTKFNLSWTKSEPLEKKYWQDLADFRNFVHDQNDIGMYPDGISFGNVSIRINNGFIITGTITGGEKKLGELGYTFVDKWNLKENFVHCEGPVAASSETLSHATLYDTFPEIGSVLHIHNMELWNKYKNKLPTTSEEIEYGTPEMAFAIHDIAMKIGKTEGILVMAGHEEGLIIYAENLATTEKLYKELIENKK